MKKVLFIDRDGTIIVEPEDKQIDSIDKLEFVPGAISGLARIVGELDYVLVMVTNQDGMGTQSFPEETFWPAHNLMLRVLSSEGIKFTDIFIDKSFEKEELPTRKPGIAMLPKYLTGEYDLANSYVVGDRHSDIQLAQNIGCKSIFIGDEHDEAATLSTTSWKTIYDHLSSAHRMGTVHRETSETDIYVCVDLDGSGKSSIETGIGFFDHMLEQLSRHGGIDLNIRTKGDLHIDPHHTIEDTALALGESFNLALGAKKGIGRYGFMLPMDDCLAQVAIDFGGRPWLNWNATFSREKIGEMPTEMFSHFFKSFSDACKCNIDIRAEGTNEHHKIESVFKAFARAIRMAIAKSGTYEIPSTKGTL